MFVDKRNSKSHHAGLAEAAAARAVKYMGQDSREEIKEMAGDCFEHVMTVFNTRPRRLLYLIENKKRRSVWHLWLYKNHRDLKVFGDPFDYLFTANANDILRSSLGYVPPGFHSLLHRMKCKNEEEFDLLHSVLLEEQCCLAHELAVKPDLVIKKNTLRFIARFSKKIRMSYACAQLLADEGKVGDFEVLLAALTPEQKPSLEKLLMRRKYASFEELKSSLYSWRSFLKFPYVPHNVFLKGSDFKVVETEASLRKLGEKHRNCLRYGCLWMYGNRAHNNITQFYSYKDEILFCISKWDSDWYVSEVDAGDSELLEELNQKLQNCGVKLDRPTTAAAEIERLFKGDVFDLEYDL